MIKGVVSVQGEPVTGVITRHPSPGHEDYIFACKRAEISDFKNVLGAKGIVFEEGGRTDHINVICRILGIPSIKLESASRVLREGQVVTMDGSTGRIFFGKKPIKQKKKINAKKVLNTIKKKKAKIQVSIINHSKIIDELNKLIDVSQFFVRHEFLWIEFNKNPFVFIKENGLEKTAKAIERNLEKIVTKLSKKQLLNFRSLDLRSDEFAMFSEKGVPKEPNPQIGMHGIRQLLLNKNLLLAELKAVDSLYEKGYKNIVFSLPFIVRVGELLEVKKLIKENCKNRIKLGVFVETPSAVSELDDMIKKGVKYVFIGTKDLTQLTLGCDRSNSRVAEIYDTRAPAIKEFISRIVATSRSFGKDVYVFTLIEDIDYYLKEFKDLPGISISGGELVNLLRQNQNGRMD